jgi:hypothetical protein
MTEGRRRYTAPTFRRDGSFDDRSHEGCFWVRAAEQEAEPKHELPDHPPDGWPVGANGDRARHRRPAPA